MLRLVINSSAASFVRQQQQEVWCARSARQFLAASVRRSFSSTTVDNNDNKNKQGIPYSNLVVGIPKETLALERRVAATPESVQRLMTAQPTGFAKVLVEQGAGAASSFADQDYERAGATIVKSVYEDSDIVLKVCVIVRVWIILHIYSSRQRSHSLTQSRCLSITTTFPLNSYALHRSPKQNFLALARL
jgi:hypothetical protein